MGKKKKITKKSLNNKITKMFALTPTFYQPLQRRNVFEDMDMFDSLVDNFFMPRTRMPFCSEMVHQPSNERSLQIPMGIPKENVKTTINKKTGVMKITASDKNETDISHCGWTGTQKSFSSFSKTIKLPEYVVSDDDLLTKITADFGRNNVLKITLPEDTKQKTKETEVSDNKRVDDKKTEDSDLVHIETVDE